MAQVPLATNYNIDIDELNTLTSPTVLICYTQYEYTTYLSFSKAITSTNPTFILVAVEDSIIKMLIKELSFRLTKQIRVELLALFPTPRTTRKELEIEITV
jgi:hypothetical protein